MSRPIKPPMIGAAWSETDLNQLKEALLEIACGSQGVEHALELLDHGYISTPLTAADYDAIREAIIKTKVKK